MAEKQRSESLEKFLVGLVEKEGGDQGHGHRVSLLLWLLRGLSRIYLGLVQLRLGLYEKRLLRDHTLGCQVISVGNLTVGGTGKTPVVEIFARELQSKGRRVAILSRGYRKVEPSKVQKFINGLSGRTRREPPRVVSDGQRLLLDSSMSGDEPYMLASNLPDVCVLVDKDRVKSGRYAIAKLGCDTLILDDGFQYLRLRPRVQVILIDATNPFSNGNVLPRGVLREPIRNLCRAHFIFITKSDGSGHDALRQRIRQYNQHAEIVECRHCPRYLQNVFTESREPLEWLQGKRVAALSGIASPSGFEKSLQGFGATITSRHRFADHHRYSEQEILNMINEAEEAGVDAIVTTEKDAVRFPKVKRRDVPVFYLRVDIEILSGARDFRECINHICFRTNGTGTRAPGAAAA